MTARSVLITGGAGFIGSALAATLSDSGDDVVLVDNLHPQVHRSGWPNLIPEAVTKFPFDVTGSTQWDALFKMVKPDLVVHLAAETGTGQSLTEASRHARVNVVGTAELLDGLSRAGHVPAKFVIASSRAVYGEGMWSTADGVPFHAKPRDLNQLEGARWDPSAPDGSSAGVTPVPHQAATIEPRPTNVYAATKLAQEHILSSWTSAHGSDLAVLRLQNVYGPGQSLTNPYTGIVALFARLALEGKSIPVYEDGQIFRDFVFVDDVVSALASASRSEHHGLAIADIGSGEPLTLEALAYEIAGQAGAPAPAVTGAFRHGDVRAASADLSAARELFSYAPQTGVPAGIASLLKWISNP